MASIPCTVSLVTSSSSSPARSRARARAAAPGALRTALLCGTRRLGWLRPSRLSAAVAPCESGRSGPTCWFRFGNRGVDAEGAGVYGSQRRDDFDRDDVEQYFNYMGMLAVEGTYDKMEALLSQNIPPVDILLMLAASEGDRPKIEELLRAGARYDVEDEDGRTALDRAATDEIKEFMLGFSVKKA